MRGTQHIVRVGCGLLALAGLQACGGETVPTEPPSAALDCVEIPDGYYLFTDGKFSPASQDMSMPDLPDVTQKSVAWVNEFEDDLAQAGHDWLRLEAVSGVLIVGGSAEDEAARQDGLEALRSAISADPVLTERDLYIVDASIVNGGERRAGAYLASMSPEPPVETCRTKADQISRAHTITFEDDNSAVSEDSHDMLDAMAGLARICRAYPLEIGVHTDARGAQSFNETRSQQRAEAIRSYLSEQGLDAGRLVPVGYGESRPIDPAQTSEAYALNRRVEFFFLRGEE